MDRVSTAGFYTQALANLNDAQQRSLLASNQVSSQKVAQDFKGYAGKAETLASMNSVQARVTGLLNQNSVLQDRYTTQDSALNQLSDAAGGASQAITDALASGSVDTLMQQMSGYFSDATAALNTKSQGRYLFAGGQVNTQPVSATSMADLTTAPVASYFHNDQFVGQNQIDETSTIKGGMLASNLGSNLFNAFKDIQAFQQSGGGPFTGQLTDAQRTFLEGEVAKFNTAHTDAINATATNGSVLKRLTSTATDLTNRSDTMNGLIGNITDVNVADAISRLQNAQTSVQISAQVFSTLKASSLLSYLPVA